MADSKLLVPELNEAETMGTETARFQELLLQVRADRDSSVPGNLSPPPPPQRWVCSSQNALGRQQDLKTL